MSVHDVRATLRYLVPTGERPIYYASTGGADAALHIGAEFEDREVTIHDARSLQTPARLDREGFELRRFPTRVSDFYDTDSMRTVYDQEVSDLVQSATGAESVLVFDHTLRSDSRSVRRERSTREPASVIHNDYTDASAAKRIRDLLPAGDAEARLQNRFAIVNVWRSVAGIVLTTPLACCDAASILTSDLVASERRAEDRIGELELASWNPDHRWYYFPAMSPDEVLLLKTFDSSKSGIATRSIHTAFRHPGAPADAAPRQSIESRLLVFFDA